MEKEEGVHVYEAPRGIPPCKGLIHSVWSTLVAISLDI